MCAHRNLKELDVGFVLSRHASIQLKPGILH